MSRSETGEALRQALASAPREGVGRAYRAEIRQRAIAYVHRRRREGASLESIGRELGVSTTTVVRWTTQASHSFALARVQTPETVAGRIVVHGPRGIRVEGLSLDELVALWERLS